MTLSDEELDRYARHIVLPQVGGVGQRKLKAASVAVVGAGGIGSAVIPALAGAGVGVSRSSTTTWSSSQICTASRCSASGTPAIPKADLAAQFVHRLNHFVKATPVQERIGAGNADELLAEHDLVIDGSDNFATRLAVSDACVRSAFHCVSAAAVQFQGQVGLFRSQALLSLLRRRCVRRRGLRQLRGAGVLGALTGTVGNFAALARDQHHRRHWRGLRRKLHLFDGEKLSWRTIRIPADPGCKVCGSA